MIFILDRSGSMQQMVGSLSRLDIAKSATLSATELLHPESLVGIVAFDTESYTRALAKA
ncbi:MAG: VWA domain-containing protein [Deinococcales bacterium]